MFYINWFKILACMAISM